MSETTKAENYLVSAQPSDPTLTVSLHPEVLLTISDLVTRHQVRGHSGNIVGALLGQQRGGEITLEHAFPCNVQINEQNQACLQTQWFEVRLQQCEQHHIFYSAQIDKYRQGCAQGTSARPCRLVYIMPRKRTHVSILTNSQTISCAK